MLSKTAYKMNDDFEMYFRIEKLSEIFKTCILEPPRSSNVVGVVKSLSFSTLFTLCSL